MTPALSAVVRTDAWETVLPVVGWLSEQTLTHRIELVVVADAERPPAILDDALDMFAGWRVVPPDDHGGRSLGVAATRAPVVFVGETHSFSDPGWAERVLRAHEEWDVVVPAFENGNPDGPLSWAAFVQHYGDWSARPDGGPLERWPGHNATYRRDLLVDLGADLEPALTAGELLWSTLRRRGARVGHRTDIRIHHVNIERPWSWVHESFTVGVMVAAARRRGWGWSRRIAYAVAGPLIALVLMRRNRPALRRIAAARRLPPGTRMAWAAAWLLRAAGEVWGYLRGASPDATRSMVGYEVRRFDHTYTPDPGPGDRPPFGRARREDPAVDVPA